MFHLLSNVLYYQPLASESFKAGSLPFLFSWSITQRPQLSHPITILQWKLSCCWRYKN